MASFKGDHNYRVYDDDDYSDSSEDDELYHRTSQYNDRRPPKEKWIDEHHEVLAELFSIFKCAGERVFGRAFFQLGGFRNFAEFCYDNTLDLLKSKVD